jgi:hypothetical protein
MVPGKYLPTRVLCRVVGSRSLVGTTRTVRKSVQNGGKERGEKKKKGSAEAGVRGRFWRRGADAGKRLIFVKRLSASQRLSVSASQRLGVSASQHLAV